MLLFASAGLFSGCGAEAPPECGNAVKETGEDCDNGSAMNGTAGSACSASCRAVSVLIPQLQAQWSILRTTPVKEYSGAACSDIGAKTARVQLAGPQNADILVDCAAKTKLFSDKLPAGKYQVTITLLDDTGRAVTQPSSKSGVQVDAGPATQVAIDFAVEDLLKPCTGSLRIFPAWGTPSTWCAQANPAVDQQTFLVTPDGSMDPVLGIRTTAGTPLDGKVAPCFTPTNSGLTPDSAPGLDCGAYDVAITGLSAGKTTYCGTFPVYVGPGTNNQPWRLTVPAGACP